MPQECRLAIWDPRLNQQLELVAYSLGLGPRLGWVYTRLQSFSKTRMFPNHSFFLVIIILDPPIAEVLLTQFGMVPNIVALASVSLTNSRANRPAHLHCNHLIT